jgi:uncharacterized protein
MPLAGPVRAPAARTWPTDPARRIEIIDALRGLALMGILQVNIQSFTWGAGDVLGYLGQPPGVVESALYFLQATFVEGKFYPIFAFLFGLGMALQLRKLGRQGGIDASMARAIYRRRLLFLFVLGLLHGLLLYFGDVLAAYAICALLFLQWTQMPTPTRPRVLVRIAWACALAAALSLFVPMLLNGFLEVDTVSDAATGEELAALPDAIGAAHTVYVQGGFLAELQQRLGDEFWQQVGSVPTFWPQVLALLALGALAGRLGWLQHPDRHAGVWKCARRVGLGLGLPCALLGAALDLSTARAAPGSASEWGGVISGIGSLLAAAYVAWAMAALRRTSARAPRRWLASAGRASLSNYLLQSLLMGTLLSGWGCGLGAVATRPQLAALGLVLFALQVVASRWWLARHRQGPMEALWRRWTYGR